MKIEWIVVVASWATACSDFESLSRGHDAGAPTLPAYCSSGRLDGDETDVDCGGSCLPCDVGAACLLSKDCQTRTCFEARCGLTSDPPGWLTVAAVPMPRYSGFSAAGADGRIYVLGGQSSSGTPPPLEVYDPDSGQWQALAPLPANEGPGAGVGLGAAFGPDGRLYAIGGNAAGYYLADVTAFDFGTNAWTSAAPLDAPRWEFATTTAEDDGRIYVLGGSTLMQGLDTVYKEDFEVYSSDPTGHWTTKPLPQEWRSLALAATSRDGLVFVLNGSTAATGIYDPAGDAWKTGPPMRTSRFLFSAVVGADRRIYALGGNAGDQLECEALDQARSTPSASLPGLARSSARARDGRIYALGESSSQGAAQPLYAYGPALVLSTSSAPANASITVSGSNFATRAAITFYWDDVTTPIASAASDDTGILDPVSVPVTPAPGPHRLLAVDDRSRYPVSAAFTIQ